MQARRAERRAPTIPSVVVPFTGHDMETGRAIARAWLSQIEGIVIEPDGAHFIRDGAAVAVIADPDLVGALERGIRYGLTSHPMPVRG
jgi:hypothetical protein